MDTTTTVKPLTPEEVVNAKFKTIPNEVMESFNFLIAKHWTGHRSQITKKEVVNEIKSRMPGFSDLMILENGWLDIEDIYRKVGWKVRYDSPAYDEDYEAFFLFTKE